MESSAGRGVVSKYNRITELKRERLKFREGTAAGIYGRERAGEICTEFLLSLLLILSHECIM